MNRINLDHGIKDQNRKLGHPSVIPFRVVCGPFKSFLYRASNESKAKFTEDKGLPILFEFHFLYSSRKRGSSIVFKYLTGLLGVLGVILDISGLYVGEGVQIFNFSCRTVQSRRSLKFSLEYVRRGNCLLLSLQTLKYFGRVSACRPTSEVVFLRNPEKGQCYHTSND